MMLAILATLASPAHAATLTVGTAAYPTIDSAVSAAASGDTIDVPAGTWTECLSWSGKELEIVGAGVGSTTINGPLGCYDVVEVDSGAVHLESLTLSSGSANSGVLATSSDVTATDVVMSAFDFFCVDSDVGDVTLTDVELDTCGTGLEVEDGDVRLLRVDVHDATASGGVYVDGSGDVTIVDSSFSYNESDQYGAGVRLGTSGAVTVIRSAFTGNESDVVGGGLSIGEASSAVVRGCTFQDNFAVWYGAGLNIDVAATVRGSTFVDNWAGISGGAVYVGTWGDLSMRGSTLYSNDASQYGGGVAVSSGAATIHRSVICENTANDGGGLYGWYADLTVSYSVIQDNVADFTGGGLASSYGTVDLRNLHMLANDAPDGSGVELVDSSGSIINTLLAWQSTGPALEGDALSAAATTVDYNDFFNNGGSNLGGSISAATIGSNNLTLSPSMVSFSNDGDCTNDRWALSAASALIDAGDPTTFDPDGTVANIGAQY